MSENTREATLLLRRENALLTERIKRLEGEIATMRPVIAQVKRLKIWDFTPYRVELDDSWLALDRVNAVELMQALAGTDHWSPWHSRIEPRPQP
ncbi:hypothetical protein E3O06_06245 [Cryobacterium glaciale]|uniref:Uncharacterized protein n=1 Tax=Cryobacterium glaciale TaxID=1259145 RepID=A0A4V3I8L1_9MICO|nr:hypothetical protein [Cryobacterium glaciale]TFB75417.1 hypothetical protein E3O06_06245 [Cryobacterium glaciale]